MTHCTMEDLIALRDGEGSVWARRHAATCALCRLELDRLYQRVAALKALPAYRPPRDRWPEVRAILEAERTERRWRWTGTGLAAAAALAAVMLARPVFQSRAYADELERTKAQSAQLESALAGVDADGRVTSGRAAAVVADLEDRIARIDGRLAVGGEDVGAAQLVEMWKQRVDLMQQLVQVRVTRASYVGL